MPTLDSNLRDQLATVIGKENAHGGARAIAAAGARAAIEALAVHLAAPYAHQEAASKQLRNQVRARARQLGDVRHTDGRHEIRRLVEQAAYEHWHRMLFARFLAENNLLIHPEMKVAVTLADCAEMAASEGATDGWELAGRYASRMLPQIFRPDDPLLAIRCALDDVRKLEELLDSLPAVLFRASDSLGWCYQFWQARKKKEVNASEVKIGADELPAVTQLFTEPYMVQFLLQNTLGAWWIGAGRGLPVEMPYLRRLDDGTPAAGAFEEWPRTAAELRVLDPCCGSGHFLVEAFEVLVTFRMAEGGLGAREACDAVLRDNVYGLEIDARCVQIAAFALALAAWTFPDAGGYRPLASMNVACSGLTISAKRDAWERLGGDDARLRAGMRHVWELFRDAPVLGSLVDPTRDPPDPLLVAGPDALLPRISIALAGERNREDDEAIEATVAADGLSRAAQMLIARYHLVVTNVPYLGTKKQVPGLAVYSLAHHPDAATDLATTFIDRCRTLAGLSRRRLFAAAFTDGGPRCRTNLKEAKPSRRPGATSRRGIARPTARCRPAPDKARFDSRRGRDLSTASFTEAFSVGAQPSRAKVGLALTGGAVAVVSSQPWWELKSYVRFRDRLLGALTWNCIASLGEEAWTTFGKRGPRAVLTVMTRRMPDDSGVVAGVDVQGLPTIAEKAEGLRVKPLTFVRQVDIRNNPDHRVIVGASVSGRLLEAVASGIQGITTGDTPRFIRSMWEVAIGDGRWELLQSTVSESMPYGGRSAVILWEGGEGALRRWGLEMREKLHDADKRGAQAWGRQGVAITQMRTLAATLYSGNKFVTNVAVILPHNAADLPAVWSFCQSPDYAEAVRLISQKVNVTNATLVKVPFDLDYWRARAATLPLNGIPSPSSPDPTQIVFNGTPRTSVAPLQVAVARLLGYQWPAQAQDFLNGHGDADGIVCIPAVRGERPAAERLSDLLAAAWGKAWHPQTLTDMLSSVGHVGSLEEWLRDAFFKQHCELFENRPFIWHIWDGHRDGFSALVNYHKLDHETLKSLTWTYLGDWIRTQEAESKAGKSGAGDKLAKAKVLQQRLAAILEGEDPLDIFVRWKPIEQQPVGWDPDLDDGVRLNIRPFLTVATVGGKGAGVLRCKPNIKWGVDRGKNPEGAPWGEDRDNDRHLTLAEKRKARGQT